MSNPLHPCHEWWKSIEVKFDKFSAGCFADEGLTLQQSTSECYVIDVHYIYILCHQVNVQRTIAYAEFQRLVKIQQTIDIRHLL